MNRALASDILIRHPPEKCFVAVCCICAVKPSPWRIPAARVSALSESSSSSLSKMSNNLENRSSK